jgi:hypothetical protein
VGAARPGPRPLVVSPGRCPPSSLLLAPWVFWQNRIFAIFSGIFPESRISAQKRDTRAILLTTALVHVSCIQNTQIRGETIAKVFRKVDMFWTYHPPPSHLAGEPQRNPRLPVRFFLPLLLTVGSRSNRPEHFT